MVETSSTFPQKLKSQGRIVVPKLVREGLQLETGDVLVVTVRKQKEV